MLRQAIASLVLASALHGVAQAADERPPPEERTFFRPLRVGMCGGNGLDCLIASYRVEVAGRWVGVGAHAMFVPIASGAYVKGYALPPRHHELVSWRPYGFVGRSWILGREQWTGGGLGADVHLTKSKILLVQPSFSMWQSRRRHSDPDNRKKVYSLSAGGSLNIMAAF